MIDEKILKTNFCKNFNNLLQLNDKKQVDVANYLKVSTAIVTEWSKGRKMPRLDNIHRIADFFGVEANDLLSDRPIPDYSPDYLTLIDLYSRLDDKGKQAVMSLAKTLAE